jgi:myo-inositol-1(or 4)-monophosphatase
VTHTVDHDDLLALATDLAVRAGRMVRDGRAAQGAQAAATKSSTTDVVTEFDRASERLIVDAIRGARPNDGLVGEEGSRTAGTSGIHWLIDPIDGTTNFLYGLPGYAVSIAACSDDGTEMGRPEVGAVYVPATDELFSAVRGRGAWLDGGSIRCTATTELGLALVATGFSYLPERRAQQARRVAALLPQVRDVRRLGAAAPDLCYVAAGRVDAYFEEFLGPWDLAAGALIAAEAGCTVTSIDGSPVTPDSVLVANPGMHGALASAIAHIDRALDTPPRA